jgi:Spy/CpxP family protein refolding chaperone
MIRNVFLLAALLAPAVQAQPPSTYAGQEARAITSLSEQDVADILAGKGWGLAKAAELNNYPGPRHVLDMASDLSLTAQQRIALEEIFSRMQAEAIAAGQLYLGSERTLDGAFRQDRIDATRLSQLSADAGQRHAALRAVHLAAHIETKALLTPHQIARYAELRGYGDGQAAHGGDHAH